jgi:CheY-like chemotaxis protein
MGLAMVHGIMQNFGGGIVLDTAVGRGTTFELYFPVADLPVLHPPVEVKSIPGGSERILCVDDEAIIVNLHRKMLTRLGYRVETFTDPAAALSMISASMDGIDLIITDMAMPVMTGDRFVEAVRQVQPNLPVILCTGYRDRVSEKTATRLNINMVLDKPVELKQLASAIRDVLDGCRSSG